MSKKIMAALAAVAVAASFCAVSAFAAGMEDEGEDITEDVVAEEEVVEDEEPEEEEEPEEDFEEDFEEEEEPEEDFEEEEEPEEEEVVVEVEETEAAPAEDTVPATGNAPVALAVIPVALAAAAVVAKRVNK